MPLSSKTLTEWSENHRQILWRTHRYPVIVYRLYLKRDDLSFREGAMDMRQAQQIWLILCAQAMFKKKPLPYGELAKMMGYADGRAGHTLGRQLGIVGYFCVLNQLAPLNAIVIKADLNAPGEGVVLRKGRSVASEIKAVLRTNWFAIRVPTTGTFRKVWDLYKRNSHP